MYSEISGIILSGGKSSRMGLNKSLLKIGDETIIGRITNLIKPLFKEIMIISNSPKDYKFLNVPLYQDIYKWKGPLAGIHSGLVHSSTEINFIISCDVPLMTKEMIEYIVDFKSNKPIKFCEAGGYRQPLAGIYNKSIIQKIEQVIGNDEAGDKSLYFFVNKTDAEIINPEGLTFYNDDIFFNVNRNEDYEELVKKFKDK